MRLIWGSGCALLVLFVATTASAYGEADPAGDPSLEERLLLVLSNQVRQDPHAWPGWDTSLATGMSRRPLVESAGLFSSSGFHAQDMADNDFFDHDSSDGTSTGDRIHRYYSGAAVGENIYSATFGGAREAITAWMNSTTGHRENLLEPSWTDLGTGFVLDGAQRYYVQNFGQSSQAKIPAIVSASVEPRGTQLRLLANHFDDAGEEPSFIRASLGDRCFSLERESGPLGNATYGATVDRPSDCSPLSFEVQNRGAELVRYPSAGALLVGAACSLEFDPSDAASACGSSSGDDRPTIEADAGCRCVASPGQSPAGGLVGLVLALGALLRRFWR